MVKDKVKPIQFLIVIFLFCAMKNHAQNDTLFFRHYSAEHGLSHRNVSSIIQDSLGFMWYGTREGLNKFDGYKFIPFKHDPTNKNSLVSDDITCLAVQKNGIIWIGTKNKGINRYDPYSDVFDLFRHAKEDPSSLSNDEISSLYVDSIHGVIWIATAKGLNALNIKTKKIKTYVHDENNSFSISDNQITCITQDKKGILWIGTKHGGLNSFDHTSGRFTSYLHDENNLRSLSNNDVRSLFADKKNTIWVATANGLNNISPPDKEFIIFKHDDNDKFSISSNDVTSVYQDKYGKIWAGTANEGLCVYYPKLGKFYIYSHEKEVTNSLSSNKINSISQGRSGMFWAATSDGGLNAFNPKTLKFNLFNPLTFNEDQNIYEDLNFIHIDKNNNLLLSIKGKGLYVYDLSLKTFKLYQAKNKNAQNINCLYEEKNRLLIGADNGLTEFNSLTGDLKDVDFKKYCEGINSKKTLPEKISCILKDRSEIIWLGTYEDGLFSYDETNKKTIYFLSDPDQKEKLSNNSISCLFEDSKGIVWIGTNGGGLNKFDKKTGKFIVFKSDDRSSHPIGGNYINRICEDKKGTIWITTTGGGLNSLPAGSNDFKCYTVHDGLPGNCMNSIMQDENSNFWIGTDNGICRLTFKDDKLFQCRIFDLIDGLPTTEFLNGYSCMNLNGRMLFSCKKGLVSFHPDSLRNNPYKPPVIISDFLLFNKYVQPGDSTGILKTCISVTDEIHLKHDQNSFSFEYTAISFINSGKNKYAYKLEGFDKDWNYRNAQNRNATFTNVQPGTYTLNIIASNNDGIWNDKGTSLIIIIASPFWKTWWFYSLAILTFLLIVYTIYYYRLQNVLKMQEVRNKISRDLHDHIGSSLSSISIYSEVAKKMTSEKSPEAAVILANIGENARVSMDSMSDIVWAINPKNDKFSSIMSRLQIFANQLFDVKDINLHFEVPETINDLKLPMQHRKNIYLILKEAVNNVAKYSEAKNCFISIKKIDKFINVEIKDDGLGFKAGAATLGGNGFINMKQRVNELNGIFNIFSEEKKGTSISFQFAA